MWKRVLPLPHVFPPSFEPSNGARRGTFVGRQGGGGWNCVIVVLGSRLDSNFHTCNPVLRILKSSDT